MNETIAPESRGPLRGPLRKRNSRLWIREQNDFYQEPRWCSERLFAQERFEGSVWDPACGKGNIVLSAREAGLNAYGTDVVERWDDCMMVRDFLEFEAGKAHNIVSNPPFGLCDDRKAGTHPFVEKALDLSVYKTALLLPANWVQGDKRSRWLEASPLRKVLFITPRPSMPPGDVEQKPGNGTTDYAWFLWERNFRGKAEIGWLRRDP